MSVRLSRGGNEHVIKMTSGIPTMEDAAKASCPSIVATLNVVRSAPAVPENVGSYLGATFAKSENPLGYGSPGMIVMAVEPGSVFANGGLRVGDFYRQREDARIGTIDTADELRQWVERHFRDDPNRRRFDIHFTRRSATSGDRPLILINLVDGGYKYQ